MKTIAVISFSDISNDSRVLKQIKSLSAYYRVVSIGFGPIPPFSSAHLTINTEHSLVRKLLCRFLFLFRNYKLFSYFFYDYFSCLSFLESQKALLFLLNDCTSWPLLRYLDPCFVLVDAHEYSPDELSDNLRWRLLTKPYKVWCSRFTSKAAVCFSVEENICSLWSSFSGLCFKLLPNSSPYFPSPLSASNRFQSPLPSFVHHGVAHPSRRIDLMVQAFALTKSSTSSDFYLSGSYHSYLSELSSLALSTPHCTIRSPVPHQELHSTLSSYRYSLISIYPSNLNYQYCLPNKLFQCIQARLPIVCGPTPSIAHIVHTFGIGVVATDFSSQSLANAIDLLLTLSYDKLLTRLDYAADTLSWDQDQNILISSVNDLFLLS